MYSMIVDIICKYFGTHNHPKDVKLIEISNLVASSCTVEYLILKYGISKTNDRSRY